MSSSAYHQSNAPELPADDSDPDLDLDIQELDPITTSSPSGPSSSRRDRTLKEERRSGHIPLRNLRMSGLRGFGKRNRGYGDLGRDRDEDAHGLLNDTPDLDGANRLSAGSFNSAEDDAPLLPGGGHRRRP